MGVYEWVSGILAVALISAVGYFLHRLDKDVLHGKIDIRADINRLENKVDSYATASSKIHSDSRELFEKVRNLTDRVSVLERAKRT